MASAEAVYQSDLHELLDELARIIGYLLSVDVLPTDIEVPVHPGKIRRFRNVPLDSDQALFLEAFYRHRQTLLTQIERIALMMKDIRERDLFDDEDEDGVGEREGYDEMRHEKHDQSTVMSRVFCAHQLPLLAHRIVRVKIEEGKTKAFETARSAVLGILLVLLKGEISPQTFSTLQIIHDPPRPPP